MNRILKLQDQIRQQSQFVEQIKVNATPDLHHCITTAYFRKEPIVSEYLSGKYISYGSRLADLHLILPNEVPQLSC
jgi:hypothetical protein